MEIIVEPAKLTTTINLCDLKGTQVIYAFLSYHGEKINVLKLHKESEERFIWANLKDPADFSRIYVEYFSIQKAIRELYGETSGNRKTIHFEAFERDEPDLLEKIFTMMNSFEKEL
jgi:hypothetical protein